MVEQISFFLNAEHDSAIFCTGEYCCIKIEPGRSAKIKGAGMEISFAADNTYIKFSSNRFYVNHDGYLTAQDADIQGHICAGGFSDKGEDAEFHPPIGAVLDIGPVKDENGAVESSNFLLESYARIGEMRDENNVYYDNVYDFVQINQSMIEFGRANFGEEPDENKVYPRELMTGLQYYDGTLTIRGSIEADSGTIGGWNITNDAIVSKDRELILYSDGHVIGLGGSDDDTNFIDINNSTITWNSTSSRTKYNHQSSFKDWKKQWRKDKENKEGRHTKASISTENGCLSMNSSSAVNISGSTSASLSAGGTSMGIYSNNKKCAYGMSISSPPTGISDGMPETIATLAGVMSKVEDFSNTNTSQEESTETPKKIEAPNNTDTGNENSSSSQVDTIANKAKYMGFLALNSTFDADITNRPGKKGIYILERTNEPTDVMMTWNTEPPPKDDTEQEDNNNSNTTDSDSDNKPVYQEKGYYVKPVEQDKIRKEYLIIEEAKDENGNSYNPKKYRPVPVSLSEAIQFWYDHIDDEKKLTEKNFGNVEYWNEHFTKKILDEFKIFAQEKDDCVKARKGKYTKSSKFNRTWKTYKYSDQGYLAPTTYAVVGLPPDKVVMEKEENKEENTNKKEESKEENTNKKEESKEENTNQKEEKREYY